MATTKMKSIKGRAVRITRLDDCGLPVYGPCSSIVTHGFITATFGREMITGDTYEQKNAYGELCINEKDPDLLKWANIGLELCEIDPGIMDIIAGANPVTSGANTIGATFGSDPPVGGFAFEVWTKALGPDACAGGTPKYGYWAAPFVKNGAIDGDVVIGNQALSVKFKGNGFAAVAGWGLTPYGDNPLLAAGGFPVGDAYGYVVTTVAPPAETNGCVTLVELPAKGAVQAGDVFAAEPTVVAQDATNAGRLAGLGYIVAAPGTAWATGEFFAVGAYHFNWSGSAWAAGAHA